MLDGLIFGNTEPNKKERNNRKTAFVLEYYFNNKREIRSQILSRHATEMELWLIGYRPTTAEILYHLPDHPHVLQSFIWQTLDLAPEFPRIHRFLDYWVHNIDGLLHSVRLARSDLIKPQKIKLRKGQFKLN